MVTSVDPDSEMASLIKEAHCGLVAPARDAQAMANAICRLFDSPDLRATLGANGRKYAEKNFSRAAVTAQHLSLFDFLIESKKHC